MKLRATSILTNTVKSRGRRLRLLSAQSFFHSSEWFFFMTIARRKGATSITVNNPVMALAYQWSVHPGNSFCMNGSTKVNITAMDADDRML